MEKKNSKLSDLKVKHELIEDFDGSCSFEKKDVIEPTISILGEKTVQNEIHAVRDANVLWQRLNNEYTSARVCVCVVQRATRRD